jgi:hypothetical protein
MPMKRRTFRQSAFLAGAFVPLFATSLAVKAWEPYAVDVAQQDSAPETKGADHLEPTDSPNPHGNFLIRFASDEALRFQNGSMMIYLRASDGKYLVKTWSEWGHTTGKPPADEKLGPTTELEIPRDVAKCAYEIWTNALFQTRYDRACDNSFDGRTDTFMAYIPGKGVLKGIAQNPDPELPPKWLEEAAAALVQYAKDRDVETCGKNLAKIHDRLYSYWQKHGIPISDNSK